ncbi:MAG: response regulator [Planctomycetes bacterium]|nr:response regulator [Planctomycetota bacterium]
MRYKILLIEDDKIDQTAFKRFVEAENLPYDCTMAGSVSQARDLLSCQHQFDVIVADYSLGDGTVLDIIDLIGDTPMVFITGAGNEEVAIKAFGAGAYGYLVKGLGQNYLETLPETIEAAVKHKHVT